MADVLVYYAEGDSGFGAYGHILSTGLTFAFDVPLPSNGVNGFFQSGNGFIYSGDSVANGDEALVWTSGNTSDSTVLSHDSNGNLIEESRLQPLFEFGSEMVFVAASNSIPNTNFNDLGLFISSGTSAPVPLLPFAVNTIGTGGPFAVTAGNYVFTQDTTGDFWRVDAQGVSQNLIDVQNWQGSGLTLDLSYAFTFQGDVVLDGRLSTDHRLYRVDSVTGNVSIMADTGGVFGPQGGVAATQFYYFANQAGVGNELFVSDGTLAGTQLVRDINPGTSGSVPSINGGNGLMATIGDSVIFTATDGSSDGVEMWVSNGTSAGTFALTGTGLANGVGPLSFSDSYPIFSANGLVFFAANSPAGGTELYVTDGTVAGTQLLIDRVPGSSSSLPVEMMEHNGLVYISFGNGRESVWVSDGTPVGTTELAPHQTGGANNQGPTWFNIVDIDLNSIVTRVQGDSSSETLTGTAFGDTMLGLGGSDILRGFGGRDTLDGGIGADDMDGGAGNDVYFVDNAGDIMRDTGGGFDQVTSTLEGYALFGTGVEAFQLGAGTSYGIGSGLNNVMSGNTVNNVLRGVGGDDFLSGGQGRDTLFGGVGNDNLRGGKHADSLVGDDGADTFEYTRTDDTGVGSGNRDAIQDFSIAENDVVDLSALDAIAGGADDAFTFIASAAFSATAGELRYDSSGAVGLLQADINGDGVVDFEIAMVGNPLLDAGDIVL